MSEELRAFGRYDISDDKIVIALRYVVDGEVMAAEARIAVGSLSNKGPMLKILNMLGGRAFTPSGD